MGSFKDILFPFIQHVLGIKSVIETKFDILKCEVLQAALKMLI